MYAGLLKKPRTLKKEGTCVLLTTAKPSTEDLKALIKNVKKKSEKMGGHYEED